MSQLNISVTRDVGSSTGAASILVLKLVDLLFYALPKASMLSPLRETHDTSAEQGDSHPCRSPSPSAFASRSSQTIVALRMIQRPEFTPRNLQGADRADQDGQAERRQCRNHTWRLPPPSLHILLLNTFFLCCTFFVVRNDTDRRIMIRACLVLLALRTVVKTMRALMTILAISLHRDFFGPVFQRTIRDCLATAAKLSLSLLAEQLFVRLGCRFGATSIWFFGPSLAECFLSFFPVTSSILVFDFTFFLYIHPSMHTTCITL